MRLLPLPDLPQKHIVRCQRHYKRNQKCSLHLFDHLVDRWVRFCDALLQKRNRGLGSRVEEIQTIGESFAKRKLVETRWDSCLFWQGPSLQRKQSRTQSDMRAVRTTPPMVSRSSARKRDSSPACWTPSTGSPGSDATAEIANVLPVKESAQTCGGSGGPVNWGLLINPDDVVRPLDLLVGQSVARPGLANPAVVDASQLKSARLRDAAQGPRKRSPCSA